jgi:predicted DNA binding CopG/RHH family protein
MKNRKKLSKMALEPEENDLLSSFEKGQWKTVKDVEKEKERAHKMAERTMRKDVRINIRLSSVDVLNIKYIAAYEGVPYQTLISSVLHKYAAGHSCN